MNPCCTIRNSSDFRYCGSIALPILHRMARQQGSENKRPAALEKGDLPPQLFAVLRALPYEWFIVDDEFAITDFSTGAYDLGISNAIAITDRTVQKYIANAMRLHRTSSFDLELPAQSKHNMATALRIRCCPIGSTHCAVLLEDISQSLRVDAMRRDFIVNVSHELKTPVGALLLLAEAIRSAVDDPESLDRFANRIQTEVERLGRLVSDITDLSRLQSGDDDLHTADIPLPRLTGEALDAVRLQAQRRQIELVVAPCDGISVTGDEEQLATALRNLVTNAINYSPEHTHITVAARQTEQFTEISVSDQGYGISESDQERIFERFYRVDPARSRETGGTGLGLAIVKHICALHHGECTVWSKPGEGSTFTLRLPLHRRTEPNGARP